MTNTDFVSWSSSPTPSPSSSTSVSSFSSTDFFVFFKRKNPFFDDFGNPGKGHDTLGTVSPKSKGLHCFFGGSKSISDRRRKENQQQQSDTGQKNNCFFDAGSVAATGDDRTRVKHLSLCFPSQLARPASLAAREGGREKGERREREGEGKRREHVHQSFKEATVRPRRPVAVTFHGRWRKWKIAKKSKRQTQNFKGLKIQT